MGINLLSEITLDKLRRILIKILVILGKTLITSYYNLIILLTNLMVKSTKMNVSFDCIKLKIKINHHLSLWGLLGNDMEDYYLIVMILGNSW